jgi:uncharacterized protein (TIGR04562 family)
MTGKNIVESGGKAWGNVPWDVLDVLISGQSSIDMNALPIRSLEDATRFVRAYGYNPDWLGDQRVMHAIIVEALHFIESQLMPDEWKKGVTPPLEILQCTDPRQLLIWTTDDNPDNRRRQVWSCAVLRVVHTIAHLEGVAKTADLEAARDQIKDRFKKFLNVSPDGQLRFGSDRLFIPLLRLDWKLNKSRESTILKLLHKRANVAETIYDRFGVRIVTYSIADAVLAAHILENEYMITFPNCVPSRARNSLVDFSSFKKKVLDLLGEYRQGTLSEDSLRVALAELEAPIADGGRANPHSLLAYQAIQFTCRQRIRWPNPLFSWMDSMQQLTHSDSSRLTESERVAFAKVMNAICTWTDVEDNRELNAFFPFEIQIMDKKSFLKNEFGDAAHDRYKRSQARTARKRVLARVLELPGKS